MGCCQLAIGCGFTALGEPARMMGAVHVFPGAPSGPSAAPSLSILGTGTQRWLGSSLEVGDFNADGLVDLVVAAPLSHAGVGEVGLHHGSPTGLSATPDEVLSAAAADAFGATLRNVGDFDGVS